MKEKRTNWIGKILAIGIDGSQDRNEEKRIKILNLFCLLGISINFFFIWVDFITIPFNQTRFWTLILGMLFSSVCIILQSKKFYQVARVSLIVIISLMFYFNANYSFKGYYGEYNYIALPLMSIFFFDRIWIHVLFLISSLLLFYLPNQFLHIYPEGYFGPINVTSLFIAIASVVFYFKYNNTKAERELAKQKKIAVDLMEQKLLRSQMNPHFIFNTMADVQNSILQNDSETAASHLSKFCKLIRETMEHSREDYISISEELELLKNYVTISNASSNSNIQLKIETDEQIDLDEDKIPSMILQPFIENSIVHGFDDGEEGLVRIRLQKKQHGMLNIIIEDNGKGLVIQKNTSAHNSLSTTITKERLMLMSKEKQQHYGLEIKNKADFDSHQHGVEILLTIPLETDA